MKSMDLSNMARWIERLMRLLSWMVTALTAAMAVILITNVCCRYMFGFSLTWSAEAARYCMVWFAFLGVAVLAHRREHLSVNLLGGRLGPGGQRVLRGMILCGSTIFFATVSVFGMLLVVRTRGQTAASIPWLPMNLIYAVIPVSGIIMTLSATQEIVSLFRNNGSNT